MNETHDDVWLVKLDDGRVRTMTLDELDAAYQSGAIHERTKICHDGGHEWITLGQELGIAPPADEPVLPSTPPVVADRSGAHHAHVASSHKRTRVVGVMLAVIVLGAFGAFAATTAVNASRTRARSALAAQLAAAAAAETRAREAADGDQDTATTTTKDDANKSQTKRRRTVRSAGNGGAPQAPEDKPAATVFTTGGNEHDPLNAKL